MSKFKEHDVVGLKGTVVHVYKAGGKNMYEVEFPSITDQPTVLTLNESEIEERYNGWAEK